MTILIGNMNKNNNNINKSEVSVLTSLFAEKRHNDLKQMNLKVRKS